MGDGANRFNPWQQEPSQGRPHTSLVIQRRYVQERPDGWLIITTGLSPYKLFPVAWVDLGVEEGWITLTSTSLYIYTFPEPLRYTILQTDVGGYYTAVLDAAVHARYSMPTKPEAKR